MKIKYGMNTKWNEIIRDQIKKKDKKNGSKKNKDKIWIQNFNEMKYKGENWKKKKEKRDKKPTIKKNENQIKYKK
jgi:hypothetical protein